MKGGGKKLRVIIIIAIILPLGALAAYTAYHRFFAGPAAGDRSYRVHSETYTNSIEIAGAISAAKEQNLQAAGSGTVTAVYVKEGDIVRKGQLILQLDDSEERYNLEHHDFELEQKRISSSPKEILLMERQREVLEQRIKDRQIIANFDGIIAQFSAAAGDVVEAKDSAGVILDRGYLKATVEVVETDAPKLRSGQKVTLKFPALGAAGADTVIEGRVYSFPAVAVRSSRGASVVKAEIRIDDPPDIILPNYSFTGEIEIEPPLTLLLVERLAIGYERPAEAEGPPAAGGGQMPRAAAESAEVPQAADAGRPRTGGGRLPAGGGPRRGEAYAEKILPGGGVERVSVRVEPYGQDFVKVISGLAEGDELKAQEGPPVSGRNRQNGAAGTDPGPGSQRQNQRQDASPVRVMPIMPGAGPSGGRSSGTRIPGGGG